ncbi:MAG: hypothetical protein ACTIMA_07250 [Brachybacterium tyrofermentans]|uniref:hypothetical protein n=1 Tax=Brachybacterium tyrofermentans TaxID=47848 RepID=UPI000A1B629A|nr:Fibrinogen-binding protein A, clumping factor [Corynebacterium xerosis]
MTRTIYARGAALAAATMLALTACGGFGETEAEREPAEQGQEQDREGEGEGDEDGAGADEGTSEDGSSAREGDDSDSDTSDGTGSGDEGADKGAEGDSAEGEDAGTDDAEGTGSDADSDTDTDTDTGTDTAGQSDDAAEGEDAAAGEDTAAAAGESTVVEIGTELVDEETGDVVTILSAVRGNPTDFYAATDNPDGEMIYLEVAVTPGGQYGGVVSQSDFYLEDDGEEVNYAASADDELTAAGFEYFEGAPRRDGEATGYIPIYVETTGDTLTGSYVRPEAEVIGEDTVIPEFRGEFEIPAV